MIFFKKYTPYTDTNGTIKSWSVCGAYVQRYTRPEPNKKWFISVGIKWLVFWFENRNGNWRIMI